MSATYAFYPLMVAIGFLAVAISHSHNHPAVLGWVVAALTVFSWSVSMHVTIADGLCAAGATFVAFILVAGIGSKVNLHHDQEMVE